MKVKGQEIRSELDLQKTFDTMYSLSKKGNEPFYNLIELMMNRETIVTAIHNIKSNKGSKTVGVDKKDINYYLQMSPNNLIHIIREGIMDYKPLPVRRQFISKENGKKRPLGIPTMVDRIIQEIAKMVIEPIIEARFFKHSYGFRPYRSTDHAIARILDLIRRGQNYFIVEGDIKGYFDNINHNKLIEIMWKMGIRDRRYLFIIKKMLKADIFEENKYFSNDMGTPQGGIISPLLANIYLNGFDWFIADIWETHYARQNVAKKNGGRHLRQAEHSPVWLVRYADDWIILCDNHQEATRALNKAKKYLKHVLSLELSPEKTIITDIRHKPASFLGFDIVAERARMKNIIVGKAIPNRNKLNNKVKEILKDINKLQVFDNDFDIAAHIEYINSKIVGVSNYYSIGNCSFLYKKADHRVDHRAYKTFTKVYGKKEWKNLRLPANKLNNRVDRHKGKNTQVFQVLVNDVHIGLTRFGFTASRLALNFNQNLTPYTEEGRASYEKSTKTRQKLLRPTIYTSENLKYVALHQIKPRKNSDKFYNFEFIMNRDYAYNRDRGCCKCCKIEVAGFNVHCHHRKPELPLDKVNKVGNLATVCKNCHKLIHSLKLSHKKAAVQKKIEKYRAELIE